MMMSLLVTEGKGTVSKLSPPGTNIPVEAITPVTAPVTALDLEAEAGLCAAPSVRIVIFFTHTHTTNITSKNIIVISDNAHTYYHHP